MTTKSRRKAEVIYVKGEEHNGPQVHIVVFPTLGLLWQVFKAWWFGTPILSVEQLTEEEIKETYETVRHWYLVKNLRGYKHRAK